MPVQRDMDAWAAEFKFPFEVELKQLCAAWPLDWHMDQFSLQSKGEERFVRSVRADQGKGASVLVYSEEGVWYVEWFQCSPPQNPGGEMIFRVLQEGPSLDLYMLIRALRAKVAAR